VILTAGILEALDQDEGRRAGCDAMIRKPFEATAFLELVRQQVNEAQKARVPAEDPERAARERIEAEVARQVEAALPKLVREITEKVLLAMRGR
jgi:FixJ family two-component response regulator